MLSAVDIAIDFYEICNYFGFVYCLCIVCCGRLHCVDVTLSVYCQSLDVYVTYD